MAEKQTAEVHTQERQRHPAQPIEATVHEAAPAPFFQGMVANPGALLDTPRLQGRGASPIRVAAMQQMQQIVGNRAVQRFIQRAARTPSLPGGEDLAQRIQMASGRGHSLDTAVQRQLEQGLGADLSDVRVHTDGEADALARAVDAVAFTSGRDIFFRQGAYNPTSSEGQWLLAHEATHVVQQAAGPVAGTPAPGGVVISHPSDSFEQAANRMADAVISGRAASPASMTGVSPAASIQRQAEGREAVPLQTPSDLSAVPVQRQGWEVAGVAIAAASFAVQVAPAGSGGFNLTNVQFRYAREQAGPHEVRETFSPIILLRSIKSLGASFAILHLVLRYDGHNIISAYTRQRVVSGYEGGTFGSEASVTFGAVESSGPTEPVTQAYLTFEGFNNPVGPGFQRFSGRILVTGDGRIEPSECRITSGTGFARPWLGGYEIGWD